MAGFFDDLEQHRDLEATIIRTTKIHKVLKNILRLESVPKDDEFNFKKRSQEMLDHWTQALSAPADSKVDIKSATNGDAKSEKSKDDDETKAKESVVEATNVDKADSPKKDKADESMEEESNAAEPKADDDDDDDDDDDESPKDTQETTKKVDEEAKREADGVKA